VYNKQAVELDILFCSHLADGHFNHWSLSVHPSDVATRWTCRFQIFSSTFQFANLLLRMVADRASLLGYISLLVHAINHMFIHLTFVVPMKWLSQSLLDTSISRVIYFLLNWSSTVLR